MSFRTTRRLRDMTNVTFNLSMSLDGRMDLERTQVVEAPEGVTHLRFRVVR